EALVIASGLAEAVRDPRRRARDDARALFLGALNVMKRFVDDAQRPGLFAAVFDAEGGVELVVGLAGVDLSGEDQPIGLGAEDRFAIACALKTIGEVGGNPSSFDALAKGEVLGTVGCDELSELIFLGPVAFLFDLE